MEEGESKTSNNIENARLRLEKDAFARHLGIVIVEMKPGYACATVKVTKELLNGLGVTHGSVIFALVDVVLAAAGNADGPEALALNVNINFLKTTTKDAILTAVAREENLTRKTGVYRMEVTDENGVLVALAQGLLYRQDASVPL